jgi:hypothetical protein
MLRRPLDARREGDDAIASRGDAILGLDKPASHEEVDAVADGLSLSPISSPR